MQSRNHWQWPLLLGSLSLVGCAMSGFFFLAPFVGILGIVLVIVGSGLLTAHFQTPGGFPWPRRRAPSVVCGTCGYDLRGLAIGAPCPECGACRTCAHCGYSLSGLPSPVRCPECGSPSEE